MLYSQAAIKPGTALKIYPSTVTPNEADRRVKDWKSRFDG